jgi:hypothetical protein
VGFVLVTSGSRALAGPGLVAGHGVGQGLVQRGGGQVEFAGDLGAVDDEGFLELILQLQQLPNGGIDDPDRPEQQRRDAAELGLRLAGLAVDDLDELAGGSGVGVVGEMPDLTGGVGVLAEGGQAFADVGDVGVGVGWSGSPMTLAVLPASAAGMTRSPRMDWAPPQGPK